MVFQERCHAAKYSMKEHETGVVLRDCITPKPGPAQEDCPCYANFMKKDVLYCCMTS